jgi:hypothetical protein
VKDIFRRRYAAKQAETDEEVDAINEVNNVPLPAG